eukprot:6197091-Pleurochrysis_carterae.AAC.3
MDGEVATSVSRKTRRTLCSKSSLRSRKSVCLAIRDSKSMKESDVHRHTSAATCCILSSCLKQQYINNIDMSTKIKHRNRTDVGAYPWELRPDAGEAIRRKSNDLTTEKCSLFTTQALTVQSSRAATLKNYSPHCNFFALGQIASMHSSITRY